LERKRNWLIGSIFARLSIIKKYTL
jgi:hypothetical protein